jgi:hypoxanthine phosphoribosyltransferase
MQDIAALLEESGARALCWPDAFPVGEFVLDALLAASQRVDGALIIASGDDVTETRGAARSTPRDNVLVELGIFLAALSRKRAALVYVADGNGLPSLPNDLDGLTHLPYQHASPALNRRRLNAWLERFFVGHGERRPQLPTPPGGHYTWSDVVRGVEHVQLLMEWDNYAPDVVLGLGRSGGVIGGMLASYLGSLPLRLLDLHYSRRGSLVEVEFADTQLALPADARRVLVVEGATTGGLTPRRARETLERLHAQVEFRFAFLIQTVQSQFTGDYYAYLESGVLAPLPWHGPRSRTFLAPALETR